MNFELTKEQQLMQQMVREFAVNEVKPIAAEIDESGTPITTSASTGDS